MAGITAENYVEMAQAFVLMSGTGGYMITAEKPVHWSAWNAYYKFKKFGHERSPYEAQKKSAMRIMIEKHERYMVPAEWPWEFDIEVTELHLGDYRSMDQLERFKIAPKVTRARAETVASAMAFLQEQRVDHLPKDHADRLKATAAWAKIEMRKAGIPGRILDRMAENDPNRLGAPKGWKRP